MRASTSIGFWGNIEENMKTSARHSLGLYELKQHKQSFEKSFFVF